MKIILLLLLLTFTSYHANAETAFIGGESVYKVVKGDTIELISSRLGISIKYLIASNKLDASKRLKTGQELKINTRRIIPKFIQNGIIVNIPDRTLYYFKDGKLEDRFPIGAGMPAWRGLARWRTPAGKFKVIGKQKNPTWYVPPSMQWKMEQEGKEVKILVSPGEDNPLGRFAIYTSINGIIIHETIKPTSVYNFSSHGCIRVMPENMENFFQKIEKNTEGEIIYNPIKIAVSQEGRVLLEIHRDVYGMIKDPIAEIKNLTDKNGVSHKVNWEKIKTLLKEKTGVPEDITL
jgi:L,D-transpeptidase ErfK/SrfK